MPTPTRESVRSFGDTLINAINQYLQVLQKEKEKKDFADLYRSSIKRVPTSGMGIDAIKRNEPMTFGNQFDPQAFLEGGIATGNENIMSKVFQMLQAQGMVQKLGDPFGLKEYAAKQDVETQRNILQWQQTIGAKQTNVPKKTVDRVIGEDGFYYDVVEDPATGETVYRKSNIKARQTIGAPVVIQTPEGPKLLDKGLGTTRPIKTEGGTIEPLMPTAEMRNRVEARRLVAASINEVKELGDRVITKIGPAQRLEGIKRGVEAVFGSDPEFRTYQDARTALAGNLAVAQQGSRPSDADIKAIWLPMVPDAYRDTRESAEMKWRLIKLMSLPEGQISPKDSAGGEFDYIPGKGLVPRGR